MSEEQMENLKELSRHELLALKEIHLTGQASDKGLVRKFVEQEMVIEVDNLSLTHRARFARAGFALTVGYC